jgi:hypothetical protein
MTPRQQLIEAIADAIANRPNPIEFAARPGWGHKADAEAALRAVADLGAVVLMPVKAKDLDEGARIYRPNILGRPDPNKNFTVKLHITFGETVYINALESEGE